MNQAAYMTRKTIYIRLVRAQDTLVLKRGIQIGGFMARYIGKDIQKLGKGEAIWQDQVATRGLCTRKSHKEEK